ncbi:hypothetical protein WT24_11750 [Burkholderia sp. MSMB1078WGS]|nr:hypothetical protein WT24_11750 [Burkholderia sp. MSMB1078WGS]
MLGAGHEALQLLPRLQIAELGHGRQLFVVQHQHAFNRDLLPLEQQARFIVLDALDARVERSLGMTIEFEIRAGRGRASHEVREVDDAYQAAELVEVTVAGAGGRKSEMVF